MATSVGMIPVLNRLAPGRDGVSTRVARASVVGLIVVFVCSGCGADGAKDSGPDASPTQLVTSTPGVRLSGDQFWATLPVEDQSSICKQVEADPAAALDIAASYAAANPVFRSQLVKTIRTKCV